MRFRQEEEGGTCSVCTGVLVAAEEDYETNLQGVEERASASESAVKEIKQRLEALRDEQATNQDDLRNAQKQFAELDQQRSSFVQRRELELRVAKLEGALEERRKSRTVRESLDNPLLAVAKAAVQETKARVDNLKTTFFEPLNDEIVSFGKSFGITQLERVQLDLAAHLQVWKGGAKTSFSKLSPGERLRLRIATIVAMLRVAQKAGIGRHPGLLIIDSPGAQESSETDVASLLKALLELTTELGHLQLFVATANAELATQVMPANKSRIAAPGAWLW